MDVPLHKHLNNAPTNPRQRGIYCWAIQLLVAAFVCCATPAIADPGFDNLETYRYAQNYMLQLINDERSQAGVGSVRLDPLASQAAKEHAQDMLANGFFSHWNMSGRKPTRRYNLLGGFNSLAENIFFHHGPLGSWQELVEYEMETLMDSAGHRKTILNSSKTHVGIGFAASGRNFYGSQEFITMVGGEYRCKTSARLGEAVKFSGRYDPGRYTFEHVLVGYEEPEQARSVKWLEGTQSYSDADKLVAGYLTNPQAFFEGISTYHEVEFDARNGTFVVNAKLDYKGKPGLYYLFLWLTDKRTGEQVNAATATVEVTK